MRKVLFISTMLAALALPVQVAGAGSGSFMQYEKSQGYTSVLSVKIPNAPETQHAKYAAIYASAAAFEANQPYQILPLETAARRVATFENLPVGEYAVAVLNAEQNIVSRVSSTFTRSTSFRSEQDESLRPALSWDNAAFSLFHGRTTKILTRDHIKSADPVESAESKEVLVATSNSGQTSEGASANNSSVLRMIFFK